MRRVLTFFLPLMIAVVPQLALGQSAGTIQGKVTDAATGDALPGATVYLRGTSLGASTDLDGNFSVSGIPHGSYTVRVSYVGYRTLNVKIAVAAGQTIKEDFKLEAVGIKGKTVVVTAQASGQNAAINEQLSSQQIVNAVSAARIQQLPDQNAAESIGRLPGVYLVRSYGEGSQIAIRGLQPKYNRVMVDGVEMPATGTTDRAVDMSMISSNMLSGIEVYKTVTPDMDAAVLGGTVNLQIREAKRTRTGAPNVELWAQGGYNNLRGTYDNYKFFGSIGKRFLDNKFGVLVQAVAQRQNLTADIFGAGYNYLKPNNYSDPGQIIINSLNLSYKPTTKKTYDGTLVLDYKWNSGKVDLMNFLSSGDQGTETFSQNYNVGGSSISYGAAYYPQTLNVIMNILDFKQKVLSFNMDARVSHAYTENIQPGYWNVGFTQVGAGLGKVPLTAYPSTVAQTAGLNVDPSATFLDGISTNTSFTRQRNIVGTLDFKKDLNISDLVNATIKFGAKYRYTFRSYVYSSGGGNLYSPGNYAARAAVIAANPWMVTSDSLNPNGYDRFPIGMFYTGNGFGNFLNGNYQMFGSQTNLSTLSSIVNTVIDFQKGKQFAVSNAYSPDAYNAIASNYSGHEYENGEYIMATVNVGNRLTLIPGVRYQGLETSYTGALVPLAYENNTYPKPFPHTDTTVNQYHGYWLPDIIVSYKPTSWFNVRAAYTNTLNYPDFSWITPRMDIYLNSVNWNNYLLKPARSQNYDLALNVYNNTIGLLTVDPFLKRINGLIFPTGNVYITDPTQYPPLPDYTKGYLLNNTQINNPNRVDLWGIELDWQTHFWYLPGPLTGLVMNVNYTHIFSSAKYPLVITSSGGYPPHTSYIDTTYTDRLYEQPSDIVNLSFGYDYQGFSARVSMKYQQNVFTGDNFWPALRKHTATYTRWDFSAKQALPWKGLQLYLDVNNLNGEPDISIIQGTGFPTSEQSYGMTADLGVRWNFE